MEVSPSRPLFPSADRSLHLDHAGVAPISTPVVDAIARFSREAVEEPAMRYPYWEARAEEVRSACACLAGTRSRQVAFVKNTSEAISFVAEGLDWRQGDVVITVDEEFPSNVYPWRGLERLGVEVRQIPASAVLGDLGQLSAALDGPVRLVAVSAIAYATGDRRALAPLADLCRNRGALLVVDAIQALGAVEMNMDGDGVDALAADGHKWMCAPEGAGFLALSDRLLDRIRPSQLGWKSVIESGTYYPYRFELRRDAARMEAGSLNLMAIHALGAAIDLLLDVGMPTVERRVIGLAREFEEHCRRRGYRVLGAREESGRSPVESGIVTFVPESDPERVRQELWGLGVVSKARHGGLRLAPHHYQDSRDVEGFFERLERAEAAAR